jgi:KaiC/GvpD/RAD55 family RecA-like ATPase
LPDSAEVPILSNLAPGAFKFGSVTIVEFGAESPWYETTLTIAAKCVAQGLRTDYHTFQHSPDDVRNYLARLGVDVQAEERAGKLRIIDSYSSQVGLVPVAPADEMPVAPANEWMKTLRMRRTYGGADETRRVHIDDNTSAFARANDEKGMSDYWLEVNALAKKSEIALVTAFVTGVYSDAFYRQLESIADNIVDMESTRAEKVGNRIRVRRVRGAPCDSSWKGIKVDDNGEVSVFGAKSETGLREWLKGPR